MRLVAAFFSLLLALFTGQASAQAADCESFARTVIAAAISGQPQPRLVDEAQLNVENVASGMMETVERLVFSTGASEIVVEALPGYYSAGKCELKSINITRE